MQDFLCQSGRGTLFSRRVRHTIFEQVHGGSELLSSDVRARSPSSTLPLRHTGSTPNQFCVWQRELFEKGHIAFQLERKNRALAKLEKKSEVVAGLM